MSTTSLDQPIDHVQRNEQHWDDVSGVYQMLHSTSLSVDEPMWSALGVPESQVQALGDVAGRDVLELGCGGAQFSISLARLGARCTGIDISAEQVAYAQGRIDEVAAIDGTVPDVSLVQGNVEATDLPERSWDIAFSDYGASMFADPHRWLPEAARLLRPGGRLAFSTISPLLEACWPSDGSPVDASLRNDYFASTLDERYGVQFNLPYGEWIRLFRRSGFEIVDLIENRPADATRSTDYRTENQVDWARRWPAENIWVLDRRA